MAKRLALGFLTVAPFAILVIFFFTPPAASWLLAVVVVSFPIALVTLAVSRNGRVGRRLYLPLVALFAMLQVGVTSVLAFSESGVNGLYGLPLSLHLLLLLMWLGPLCVTTLSYAVTFPELGIDDALLERLDQLKKMRRDRESNPSQVNLKARPIRKSSA